MSKAVDDLTAAVQKETTVINGALSLIKGFGGQVLDAKDDPVRIEQVVAQMNQNADALAAAVAAVPPATPAPAPAPPPPTPAPQPGGNPQPAGTVVAFRVLDPQGGQPHALQSTFAFQVAAIDASGQIVQGYAGSVNFNTQAPGTLQGLPSQYTFDPNVDHGVHVFQMLSHGVGTSTVTVTDISNPNVQGFMTITIQ